MNSITGPCIEDPEAWFPNSTDYPAIQHAKAVCHTCPAKVACLELAMSNEHGNAKGRDGIYGGTTPQERARMAKGQPRPINHGTAGGYRAHKRRGEDACGSCLVAHRVACVDWESRQAAS